MCGLPALMLAPANAGVQVLLGVVVDDRGDVECSLPLSGGRPAAPMTLAMVAVSEIAPESRVDIHSEMMFLLEVPRRFVRNCRVGHPLDSWCTI